MNAWGKTDKGLVRTQNQDAFFIDILREEDVALCVVCDGMGGARAGNVASELGASVFIESIKNRLRPQMTVRYIIGAADEAVLEANTQVYARSKMDEAYAGMGTTLVGAIVHDGEAVIVNIGDSRAYLIHPETGIERLTRDHSVVEDLVIMGDLTKEQARTHPSKNLITRALGTEEEVECDIYHREIGEGEFLLLCSDGLTNLVEEQEILYEILHGGTADKAAARLCDLANSRGGTDNITVVLLAF
ncbi:Stp1/IreP family PP2C-type Ser/Thr phosphatase [Oscillospiraceae bacterium OttesenSCG-928-F05]|nr:Stp1/IreP family PP2C-type Ser/Thr phosphatase [Oscillospiraceae bacterium OttesenSCG-928-F05]